MLATIKMLFFLLKIFMARLSTATAHINYKKICSAQKSKSVPNAAFSTFEVAISYKGTKVSDRSLEYKSSGRGLALAELCTLSVKCCFCRGIEECIRKRNTDIVYCFY